jgi:2-amino-4-hydroxy-6-hydroxymethyldihydropteridine diphosphokinase
MTARYWIGLGSNLGDRRAALAASLEELSRRGLGVDAVSGVYETSPQDLENQPAFLNAVARVESTFSPPRALDTCKQVEAELGRDSSGVRFGPRTIDCDLLLWSEGTWTDTRLEIPHPRLAQRRFALLPLLELDPDVSWPDGTPVADALAAIDASSQPARRLGELESEVV